MAKPTSHLLPATIELLTLFGGRLRLARQRRKLSAKQVAERAGMAPMTLRNVEQGGVGVTIGAYVAVMQVLGVEQDLTLLVATDSIGRELQDSRMAPTRAIVRKAEPVSTAPASKSRTIKTAPTRSAGKTPDWAGKSGFASTEQLARLVAIPSGKRNKKR